MNKLNQNTTTRIFKNLTNLSLFFNITINNNNKHFHSYTTTNLSLYNLSRFKNGKINNNNYYNYMNYYQNFINDNKPIFIFEQQKRWHIHHHGHKDSGLIAITADSKSRGTKITLWGLASNVGLTAAKGVAGLMMNSASLVADAAHSLSDLITDFVTLYTFRKSRRPADATHPYGYGKYETIGSLAVSSLLIIGAVGIGHHSYELLADLFPSQIPTNISEINGIINSANTHTQHTHPLNPNAAWFAAASVAIKEALFRVTLKIGMEERSNVLIANAWHHRSDAASSLVALGAIVGSYVGFPFLDPMGGMLVAGMILKSGFEVMFDSLKELVDVKVEEDVINQVEKAVEKLKANNSNIVNFHSIRGRKSGPFHLIDMVLQVNPDMTVSKAHHVEEQVRQAVKNECKSVREVLMHLDVEDQQPHH
ncbi:cation efflux family-domain-containing protein [Glomus cerebriforme]|uniref:Cation efflux family-domain-containing protein n=1 Tax=Glomus cerebriforme TaxID=658196 RepID=A0A397SZS4_9GLOM|nr:cation efflux family-domain-containing protein [Glomus cerebriforme]